ncbi:MAG: 50S ribosomal protein L10 [Candidatus Thermoplasmatota archaeon]|nr:50S ribosomal protein L10 [Candidatus Thermoplasmatota archaeon]
MSEDIPVWKEKEVKKLTNLLETSPVVGIVDIEGIPALQMQQMRAKLRGTANLRVSKNTFLEKAIDRASEDRDGLEDVKEFMTGQVAIVSTNLNPFKLFNRMEETKTKAPASGGETAPDDVEVDEGETPFKPGPIVGDLQKVGIPASIQSGKVMINQTKTVVEEGETISSDLANMLSRLDINPITVGLDLKAVYEDGLVYKKDDLDIDPSAFIEDIKRGASSAFALSMSVSYPTEENIVTLVSQSQGDAMSLAFNADIINEETIKPLLSQVSQNMMSLASKLDSEALDEELREELGIEPEEETQAEEDEETDEEESEEDQGDEAEGEDEQEDGEDQEEETEEEDEEDEEG